MSLDPFVCDLSIVALRTLNHPRPPSLLLPFYPGDLSGARVVCVVVFFSRAL